MLFEPVGPELLKLALIRAKEQINSDAKKEVERRRTFYNGSLKAELHTRIDEMFNEPEERKQLKALASVSVNVLKFAVDEISTVYRYGAERRWNYDIPQRIDGKEITFDVKSTEAYAKILEQCDADETLDKVDKLVTNCSDVILRYQYLKDYGHSLFPMTRNMCDIIQSATDPRIVTGVIWNTMQSNSPAFDGKSNTKMIWHYADSETFREYDSNGSLKNIIENPFAKLNTERSGMRMFYPFFDFHDEIRDESFWREDLDESMIEGAIEVCLWLTYLNGQLKFSTFKQAWKTSAGTGSAVPRNQALGWTKVIDAGLNGSMGLLDYTVSLEQTMAVLNQKLNLFAKTLGLADGVFQITKDAESGYSIKLKSRALSETRQTRTKRYIKFERALGRCIQFASNPSPVGAGFDDYPPEEVIDSKLKAELITVDYQEPKIPLDAKDDKDLWDWKIKMGFNTRADYLVAKNPDITLAQAQLMVEENITINQAVEANDLNAKDYGIVTKKEPEESDE